MTVYRITVGGTQFDVRIIGDPSRPEVQVEVDGETLTVAVSSLGDGEESESRGEVREGLQEEQSLRAVAVERTGHSAGDRRLVAPLPGTVIQVSVEPDQVVGVGDELLVIEAMKMNNQIRSPRRGTVGEILTSVGQQVRHGEPLLTWKE